MDQPTTITIEILGKTADVKRAALTSKRCIDWNKHGFKEEDYQFYDSPDFAERLKQLHDDDYGSFELSSGENIDRKLLPDGAAGDADDFCVSSSEQQSYSCVAYEDIEAVAEQMVRVSPDVEFHIVAVITITNFDGYDLLVHADYKDKQLKVYSEEEYFDCEGDDEDYDEEDYAGEYADVDEE